MVIYKESFMNTILITGCSSGIGKETAMLFARKGWNVAAGIRDLRKKNSLPGHPDLRYYHIDVTDRVSVEAGIAAAIKDFGSIDVLINNAGVYTTRPLESCTTEEIDSVIGTNVTGTLRMIREVLPYFRAQGHGTIVNVSSVAGRTTFPFQTVYHGTKWAIEGISESLAFELKDLNIRVKVVEPGMVKTSIYDSTLGINANGFPEEYRKQFMKWYRFLEGNIRKGYDPARDALTIYKAATGDNGRLRYITDSTTQILLLMRAVLPFPAFRRMISAVTGV